MPRGTSPASVPGVEFSRELRDDVLAGDITLSVRLWKRPQVKEGGRYRVGPGLIEVDAIELVPFAAITEADVRRAGEPDRETLRDRAAHAGPIDEDTLVYRIELHAVSPERLNSAFLSDESRKWSGGLECDCRASALREEEDLRAALAVLIWREKRCQAVSTTSEREAVCPLSWS